MNTKILYRRRAPGLARSQRSVVGALGMLALAGALSAAQTPKDVHLPDEASCRSCRIDVTKILTLGGAGQVVLGWNSSVVVDSKDRFIAAGGDGSTLYAFSSRGRLLRQSSVAKRLDGRASIILDIKMGPADTVMVGDISHRVTVFSPDLVAVREFVFPADFTRSTVVPRGLIAANIDRVDLAFFDPKGARVASHPILPADRPAQDRCPHCDRRWLSAGADSGLWATRPNRFELERISSTGVVQTRLTRTPKWFVPWTTETSSFNNAKWVPQPRLGPARDAGGGVVWVVATVPSGKLRTPVHESQADEDAEFETLQESILQAVDVESGTILAERRFPGTITLLSPSLAYAYRSNLKGGVLVDILKFELSRHPAVFK